MPTRQITPQAKYTQAPIVKTPNATALNPIDRSFPNTFRLLNVQAKYQTTAMQQVANK